MKHIIRVITVVLSILLAFSCRKAILESEIDYIVEQPEISDWTDETHSSNVMPDYSVVFNDENVLRFDIKIEASDWEMMIDDLQSNIGSQDRPGPGQGPGGMQNVTEMSEFDPIWVPCSFFFNNTEWYNVGIRFKGNSSLNSTYMMGIEKFSFKLDFDQYEDDYPVLTDQRFYGFRQLNLKNNFEDASMVREKVASDLFREFGVPSPRVAFCEVYVDFGSGPIYFGLYSIVEEVDDTMISTQFQDGSGNLYKPDGEAASFADGTYNELEMEKKTNIDLADYSDVLDLYNALHHSSRNTDVGSWKRSLESSFDVSNFLKWLAANTVMQNWDTYGNMTHNYYLYNNQNSQVLSWIPWDNNEALQEGKMGGALSLSLNEVNDSWPLISYIIADDEYSESYRAFILEFTNNYFNPDKLELIYEYYKALLGPFAYAESHPYTFLNADSDFDEAYYQLTSHVYDRQQAVTDYLQE